MKNRRAILKPKLRLDSSGQEITDVIVLNLTTGKIDPEYTKYNYSFDKALAYKAFLDEDGILNEKQYTVFDLFLQAYKERFDREENKLIVLNTKVHAKDFFSDDFQDKINSSYLNMIKHPEWFNVDESLYNDELKSLGDYLSDFSTDFVEMIKDEFLFSNIYGTTKMEDIDLTESVAKRIYKKEQGSKTIEERQFTNNRKAFQFAIESLRGEIKIQNLRDFHSICTAGLDAMKLPSDKELDYVPGNFRKNSVNIQGKYQSPLFLRSGFIDELSIILENTYKLKGLSKIVYFHLCFYLLHVFQNGNKRTTRIAEYALFKEEFPSKFSSLIGMGYYFFSDNLRYYKILSNVMASYYSEESIKYFKSYYETSFVRMIIMSKREMLIKKKINTELKGFNESEKEIFEHFWRNEIVYERELIKTVNKKMFDKSKAYNPELMRFFLENKFKENWESVKIDGNEIVYRSKIYIPIL